MPSTKLIVGQDLHVQHRTGEDEWGLCLAAKVGGFVGSAVWATIFQFTGPRIAWIGPISTRWHLPEDCTTNSGSALIGRETMGLYREPTYNGIDG